MAQPKARTAPQFRVLVGCSFPPREREHNPPGSIVDDVPSFLVASWCEQGIIEPFDGGEAA